MENSTKNNNHPGAKDILMRLRLGAGWLMEQHNLWKTEDSRAVTDDQFGAALMGWSELEVAFRCSGYTGCIWGKNNLCTEDAPVVCDSCINPTTESEQEILNG